MATRSGSQSQREQDVEPRARCAPRPPGFGQARCSEAGQGRPHSPLVFTFPFPSPAWPVGSSGHSRPFSLQSQPPELLVPSASDVSLPDTFWSRRCPGRLGRAAPPSPTVPATPGRAPAGPAQFLPCVSAAGSPWAAPRRASWSQADCSRPRTAACFRRAGPWRGRRGAAPLVGGSAAVWAQVCGAQVCAGLFFSFLPRGFPLLRACARATWACSVTAAKRGRSAPPSLGPFLSPASLRRHACVCACAGVRARVDVRARVPIVHACLMTRGPVLACAHVCLRVIACRHRAHTCRCASHADTLHAPPSGACVYTNMCTRCRHACTRVSRCVYTWHMAYSNPCAMHVHTRVCVCLSLVVYVDTCVRATVHPHVGGVTTHVNTRDDACACVGVCILCWSIPPCLACLGPGTRGVFSVPRMAGPCHARASRGGALGQHSARLSRPSGLTLQRGSWKPAGAEHLLRDAPPAATPSQWTPGVGVSAPSTSAAPLGGHQCPEGVSGPGSVEEGPRAHKPTPKAGVSHKAATDRLFWFIILELEASLGPQLPTP